MTLMQDDRRNETSKKYQTESQAVKYHEMKQTEERREDWLHNDNNSL